MLSRILKALCHSFNIVQNKCVYFDEQIYVIETVNFALKCKHNYLAQVVRILTCCLETEKTLTLAITAERWLLGPAGCARILYFHNVSHSSGIPGQL